MSLYRVNLVFTKEFYVEAENEIGALEHDATVDEQSPMGDVDVEFIEGSAELVSEQYAQHVRANKPDEILK